MLDDVALTLMSGDGRRDDLGDGVLRTDLRGAGPRPVRAGGGVDPGDGALASRARRSAGFSGRCRVHRAEMLRLTWPCEAPRRKRSRRARNCGRGCDASSAGRSPNSGTSACARATSRGRRRPLSPPTTTLDAPARTGAAAPRAGRRRRPRRRYRRRDRHIPFDVPSKERPPFGGLRTRAAARRAGRDRRRSGDVETARRAADELRSIAATFGEPGRSLRRRDAARVARRSPKATRRRATTDCEHVPSPTG